MMQKKILLSILIITLNLSSGEFKTQDSQTNLKGTIWTNSNYEECTSTIEFLDEKSFKHFYCTVDETTQGDYRTEDGMIVLDEYQMRQNAEGKPEKNFLFKYHLTVTDSMLVMQKYYDYELNWEDNISDTRAHYVKKSN